MSKQIDITKPVSEYLGDSKDKSSLGSWLNNLKGFTKMVEAVVEGVENGESPTETLDWFYEDGWEDMYGEGGNFYKPDGKYYRLYRGLVRLREDGYDIEKQWGEFASLLGRVWKALPDFYEAHPEEQRIEKPHDYDPEKPFPEFQLDQK